MSGKTVLSDFGVAAMMGPTEKFKTTYVGSPLYMAPEVTSNQQYNQKCDVWSFGICLYQLFHGQIPYENLPAMEAVIKISKEPPPKISSKRNCSKSFREVLEACLKKDVTERATVQQLKQMKFWARGQDKTGVNEQLREYEVRKVRA